MRLGPPAPDRRSYHLAPSQRDPPEPLALPTRCGTRIFATQVASVKGLIQPRGLSYSLSEFRCPSSRTSRRGHSCRRQSPWGILALRDLWPCWPGSGCEDLAGSSTALSTRFGSPRDPCPRVRSLTSFGVANEPNQKRYELKNKKRLRTRTYFPVVDQTDSRSGDHFCSRATAAVVTF